MKSILTAILVVIIFFNTSAQTQQTRQVSGFTAISASGSFNVHVKIDGTETVKVVADEKDINDVETLVENGTLNIRQKHRLGFSLHNITNWHKVDVYVTSKALSSLTSSGSGSIQLDGSLTGNASLKTSGSGNIKGNVNASNLAVSVSGSGNITSAITTEKLTASVSGSGGLTLMGNVKDAEIKVSGSGHIKAQELKADVVKATVSGSGNIYITAQKSLEGHSSGSGNIIYTGNATNVNVSSSGSGKVKKG
jgi:hypothetical protein